MLLLPLLLSHFSRVRLCVTPQTAAQQAPLSLGYSRQEHWSGLPFSSPMHESEKWKWSRSVVSNTWTAAYQTPPPMGFSRQEYWNGLPFPYPTLTHKALIKVGLVLQESLRSLWTPGAFLPLLFSHYSDQSRSSSHPLLSQSQVLRLGVGLDGLLRWH